MPNEIAAPRVTTERIAMKVRFAEILVFAEVVIASPSCAARAVSKSIGRSR
jgi:hypothetical protein